MTTLLLGGLGVTVSHENHLPGTPELVAALLMEEARPIFPSMDCHCALEKQPKKQTTACSKCEI